MRVEGLVTYLNDSEFWDMMRGDEYSKFSYEAVMAIFEYLEETAHAIDEPIAIDTLSIRTGFSEFKSLRQLEEAYGSLENAEDSTNDIIELESGGYVVNKDFN